MADNNGGKKWPWYPKEVEAYRRDTAGLSMMEHGAYNLLLDEYYHTGKPLPGDFEKLCRITRAVSQPERDALQAVLDTFFSRRGDLYYHKRVEEELDKRRQLSEARKGAAMGRWKNRSTG